MTRNAASVVGTVAGLGLAMLVLMAGNEPRAFAEALPAVPPSLPLPGGPSRLKPPGQTNSAEQLVKVRSLADVTHVRPGQTFYLAFIFDIEPHWHIYWQNSGASGAPTSIRVTAPHGYHVGRTLFPRPQAFVGEEGVSYGYEGQTALFVEMTAPIELRSGVDHFTAQINWMVCKDVCLLGRTQQAVSVNTLAMPGSDDQSPAADPIINTYKARLPQPLKDVSDAAFEFDGQVLTIEMPAQGKRDASFFPIEMPGVTYEQPKITIEDDKLTITVEVAVNPGNALDGPMAVAGVVALGQDADDPCFEFEIPVSAS